MLTYGVSYLSVRIENIPITKVSSQHIHFLPECPQSWQNPSHLCRRRHQQVLYLRWCETNGVGIWGWPQSALGLEERRCSRILHTQQHRYPILNMGMSLGWRYSLACKPGLDGGRAGFSSEGCGRKGFGDTARFPATCTRSSESGWCSGKQNNSAGRWERSNNEVQAFYLHQELFCRPEIS